MSETIKTPERRRKRPQSHSPDMFGGNDDSLLEFPESDIETTPKSNLPGCRKSRDTTPTPSRVLRRRVSQTNTQSSLCSSLRSTADSGEGNRLNSRIRDAIQANRTRVEISDTCATNPTPAVYTLNQVSSPATTQKSQSGPFYGLSQVVWESIRQSKGISGLYQWQADCLTQATASNKNLLYSLPTSGGKTLVSEILMVRELLCAKKHCLYVLPYVSIVQEKVRTLSPLAVTLEFAVEEFAGNRGSVPPRQRQSKRCIYVATLEKAHGIVNSLMEAGRLHEIGLVVVDEVHIIGEAGKRGAVLETLLCKLLLAPVSPRVIAMSATVGNLNELADFLKADVFVGDFRPVELKEYIKIGDSLLTVNEKHRRREDVLRQERDVVATAVSRKIDPDGLGLLVAEVVPQHCCLVFCPTKKNCESVAQMVSRSLPRSLLEWKTAEKRRLKMALQEESGQLCPILKTTLPFGVAYHHSGLTADERQLIEEAFLGGVLCCLCCTSTLAAGVNLPARRVILRSPYMGSTRLSRSRYQQMIGRAGRAGLDTHGESVLIVKHSELSFVIDELLLAPTDRVHSQLTASAMAGLQHLILGVVALDLGASKGSHLADTLLQATLLGQQNDGASQSGRELIDRCVAQLVEKQLVSVSDADELCVTKLGRAALKGCVDLDRAAHLYKDLRQAQAGLVLLSKLHLMYLVTPYDLIGTVQPIPSTYFNAFHKMSDEETAVARSLGINEAVVVKLMACQEVRVERSVLQRFYLTLMLNELWKGESLWHVAETYGCTRGDVQTLLQQAASFASCVHNFAKELDEFWAFSELLLPFSRQLSLCCTAELVPLLELPSVARGRARLLYRAGLRSLADVAAADAADLVRRVDHLPHRIAHQIVAAAKVLVYEKADSLRDQADLLLMDMDPARRPPRPPYLPTAGADDTFQTQASFVSLGD